MWTQLTNDNEGRNVIAAYDIGLKVPPTQVVGEDESFDSSWEIENNVAIQKIDGIPVSFLAWWDGEKFTHDWTVIKRRRLLTGDLGPIIDDSFALVTKGSSPMVNKQFKKIGELLKSREPDFTGFAGMSVTINSDIFYRKVHFRVTETIIEAMCQMYDTDITLFDELMSVDEIDSHKYGAALRLYDYPYNVREEHIFSSAHGKTVKEAWARIEDQLDSSLCYRTDGDKICRQTINNLKKRKVI
jgi:hypothetical protein